LKLIKETDLPGIGKKFLLNARSGDKIVVIIHDDGRREIYHYDLDNPDDSISMVTLDDEESRCIAAILGGMTYRPQALEAEIALGDMVIEWYKIEAGAFAIGKTIGDLRIRRRTGGTIIAIVEQDQSKTINPGPESMIKGGATIVILGEKEQVKACKQLVFHGSNI